MATNRVFADKDITRRLPVTAALKSGDPECVGKIPCVLLTDADSDNNATVQLDGEFHLSVLADNGSSSAVAVGDILYLTTRTISKLASGTRFGYAMEAIDSGTTATIRVKIGY